MVWMHGGAHMGGSTSNPVFDGTRLAVEGGVVVVTVDHRVGMEGYAQIGGAPANRRLLDMVAALHWVQRELRSLRRSQQRRNPHERAPRGYRPYLPEILDVVRNPDGRRRAGTHSREALDDPVA